jgi:hypothetical protein
MKFYGIDNALQEAIFAGDKAARVKIDIASGGGFESVDERDIIEANFYGLKEAARAAARIARCACPFLWARVCYIFGGLFFTLTTRAFRMSGGRGASGLFI